MGRREKQSKSDDGPAGAPEWMVTFSDCMTLLLTFFVLLLSFSSFDEKVFKKLNSAFSSGFSSIDTSEQSGQDAFLATEQIFLTEEHYQGNEKPTLKKGDEDRLKKETDLVDYRKHKVFLWPSSEIFWGNGSIISSRGHKTLATVAEYLKKAPGRLVISENKQNQDKAGPKLGLARAWSVMKYLTEEQGLEKNRFSLSAMSTIGQESRQNDLPGYIKADKHRGLEIVLLDRKLYN